jgi:hypothetical protein
VVLGKLLRAGAAVFLLTSGMARGGSTADLPVYIEDSHAGTFYWILQNLPLNREHGLVLIDAHSDASEILNSDSIRRQVLRAATDGQLEQLVRAWRSRGAIQSFNWVEPLIPSPIAKVWWVPAEKLTVNEIVGKRHDVEREINAHEPAWPRGEGGFGRRYEVVGLDRLAQQGMPGPLVVSVDLDFFAAETSTAGIHSRIERVLDSVLRLPGLEALTFSISRPYLTSDSQADTLLYEVLRYLTHVVNVDIHYEPFLHTGEDRSRKAKEFYRKRAAVPHYEIEHARPLLRSFVLQSASRIVVGDQRERWERMLDGWQRDEKAPRVVLSVDGRPASASDDYLIPADVPFGLRIENAGNLARTRIHWKAVIAVHDTYNLINERQGFADGAPKYLCYRDVPIDAADGRTEIQGDALVPFLDKKTGLGTLRVYCELSGPQGTYVSNVVRLSRYRGDGYVGKLTEIFNLPYVYGSALLRVGDKASADARYGADCSHFIIYGRRRCGRMIPYVNPQELLPYLDTLAEVKELRHGIAYSEEGPIPIAASVLAKGMLLHFGKHVAAVYTDADHTGLLNENTLVVHQLEGYPEITTFGVMAARYRQIRVMTFK